MIFQHKIYTHCIINFGMNDNKNKVIIMQYKFKINNKTSVAKFKCDGIINNEYNEIYDHLKKLE